MKRRNLNERIKLIWIGSAEQKRKDEFQPPPYDPNLINYIKSLANTLEKRISVFDIESLLCSLGLWNMTENSHPGVLTLPSRGQSFIEYFAALALKNNNPGKIKVSANQALKIQEKLSEIFWFCLEYNTNNSYYISEKNDDFWNWLSHIRTQYMLIRGETFARNFLETAHGLFFEHSEYLEHKLGFNVSQGIFFVQTIFSYIQERLEKEQTYLVLNPTRSMKKYAALIKDRKLNFEDKYRAEDFALASILGKSVDVLSFGLSELLEKIEKKEHKPFMAFLNRLSTKPGEIRDDFLTPLDDNPLLDRPIIQLNNKYLFPLSSCLARWLVYSLDRELVQDKKYLNKYKKAKSIYLERETLKTFGNIFPNTKIYNNLKYSITENGIVKNVELDGLLMFDGYILLIECASHPV